MPPQAMPSYPTSLMKHKHVSSRVAHLLQFLLLIPASPLVHATEIPEAYVVYMGSSRSEGAEKPGDVEAAQLRMLSYIIPRHYFSSTSSNRIHSIAFPGSPRDTVGHGTHTASTAAGATVNNASYYGLAQGVAKGGSPLSRLAMYKACSLGGCASSAVLKAIDDAISDGVDIISISLGMSSVFQTDFLSDPIAIGAFHADQNGIMVVCSGGNDGPDPFTVVNTAPWILTVGASSIDRNFQSTIILGNAQVLEVNTAWTNPKTQKH